MEANGALSGREAKKNKARRIVIHHSFITAANTTPKSIHHITDKNVACAITDKKDPINTTSENKQEKEGEFIEVRSRRQKNNTQTLVSSEINQINRII